MAVAEDDLLEDRFNLSEEVLNDFDDEAERFAALDVVLDESSQAFIDNLIDKIVLFMHELIGYELYPYELVFAERVIESLLINDGEEITALFSRQSGKTETIADVVATLMILLPRLALMFPDLLGKYRRGFWVGCFAPIEDQVENLFSRIVMQLTTERATDILLDPEIDDLAEGKGKLLKLKKSGSYVRMQTANPRAKIEGRTYHLIIVDEAQDADEFVVRKCYAEGTPVWLPDGRVVPVEKVVAEQLDVLTYDTPWQGREVGDLVGATPSEWYDNGEQEVWRVTLGSGKSVEVTANHRWYIRRRIGNREVQQVTTEELQIGDGVPVPKGVDFWGDWGTEWDGYFFGSMLGDGCLRGDKPQWCGHADGATEQMRTYVEKMGCHARLYHVQDNGLMEFGFTKPGNGPNPITNMLREHGLWGLKGADKALQRQDYSCEFTRGFLAGLFDSDGSVGRKAEIASISEQLMRQVLTMLTKFGVYASLTRRKQNGDFGDGEHDLWVLSVKGIESVRRLHAEIELRVEDKGEALRRLACVEKASRKSSTDVRRGYSKKLFFDRIVSIESVGRKKTYCVTVEPSHTVIVDGFVCCQSIHPMGASTNATVVKTGTPSTHKGDFYKAIQLNKRRSTRRGARQNHFEADWKLVSKSNENYGRYVRREMLRLGEDSDEFQLAYALKWLLERGMFVTTALMEELGDVSMPLVRQYWKSPVVVGIDPARKLDSTVVTVVWVDWDNPDEFGYYDHRVLNWLEIHGGEWEDQYFEIVNFLANYDVLAVGVDSQGVGDAVADRLDKLLRADVFELGSDRGTQSDRWKHLMALMERRMVGWPAHAKTRQTRVWKRFNQQMIDLEKRYEGPYMLAEAPDEAEAHDDFPDSLALACALTKDMTLPEVQVSESPFYSHRRR